MKKTAVHFRIAAWSIKNPIFFYAIASGGILVLLLALLFTMVNTKKNNLSSLTDPILRATTAAGDKKDSIWSVGGQFQLNDHIRCLERKRQDTGLQVFSCYEKVKGVWQFRYTM